MHPPGTPLGTSGPAASTSPPMGSGCWSATPCPVPAKDSGGCRVVLELHSRQTVTVSRLLGSPIAIPGAALRAVRAIQRLASRSRSARGQTFQSFPCLPVENRDTRPSTHENSCKPHMPLSNPHHKTRTSLVSYECRASNMIGSTQAPPRRHVCVNLSSKRLPFCGPVHSTW